MMVTLSNEAWRGTFINGVFFFSEVYCRILIWLKALFVTERRADIALA